MSAYNPTPDKRRESLASLALDSLADELTDIVCALRDRPSDPAMVAYALSCAQHARDTLTTARESAEKRARILAPFSPPHTPELVAASVSVCAACGERWPCSDSQRRDIAPLARASHSVKR